MSAAPPAGPAVRYSIVIPTIGRPSLGRLLAALAEEATPSAESIVVVDDRPDGDQPLALPAPARSPLTVLRSGGRGPAAARNVGWRATVTPWVCFLDDDVVPEPGWSAALGRDLSGRHWSMAGSQGRVTVPLPAGRRPTDWERNVAGLERAQWITADMAFRWDVLEEVGGFDERYRRAFREDSDLGLRVTGSGYQIAPGERRVLHPPGAARRWASVRAQAGNFDDTLMRARHGCGWRGASGAGPGRNGRHLATTVAAATAIAATVALRPRLAATAGTVWCGLTGAFAAERIIPGPRTRTEIVTMLATSAAIPPVAVAWATAGWLTVGRRLADRERAPLGLPRSPLALDPPRSRRPLRPRHRRPAADPAWRPELLLFDRDGTLIVDVPANRDPDRVMPMPGARAAVQRARDEGLRIGVVTNQAAVGRGQLTVDDVAVINKRVEEIFGVFDCWQICPHRPEDACRCRKPQPGLVLGACARVGVTAGKCVVIGDIGTDLGAATAAGARSVLVPTRATKATEIVRARTVAPNLLQAVELALAGMC